MKLKAAFTILYLLSSFYSVSQSGLNKKEFYALIGSNNIKGIDAEILQLKNQHKYIAYEGALLMKKSGLIAEPKEKLSLFKSGRAKLEDCIKKDTSSAELHFLRLIIQENSPKILQYNQEIKRDASYLRANYTQLQWDVQQALYNYCQQSKELKPEDFKSLKHD